VLSGLSFYATPFCVNNIAQEAHFYETGTYTIVKEKDVLEGMKQRYKDVGLEIEQMWPIVSSCRTGYHRAGKIVT